jgi:hypothetical protein
MRCSAILAITVGALLGAGAADAQNVYSGGKTGASETTKKLVGKAQPEIDKL